MEINFDDIDLLSLPNELLDLSNQIVDTNDSNEKTQILSNDSQQQQQQQQQSFNSQIQQSFVKIYSPIKSPETDNQLKNFKSSILNDRFEISQFIGLETKKIPISGSNSFADNDPIVHGCQYVKALTEELISKIVKSNSDHQNETLTSNPNLNSNVQFSLNSSPELNLNNNQENSISETNSNNITANISELFSPESNANNTSLNKRKYERTPRPLQSLDTNSNQGNQRPKRAAALAASTSIRKMKRKLIDSEQISTENSELDKENSMENRLTKNAKRRRGPIPKKTPNTKENQINSNLSQIEEINEENLSTEAKEEEIIKFLSNNKQKQVINNEETKINQVYTPIQLDFDLSSTQSSKNVQKNNNNSENQFMTLELTCESDDDQEITNYQTPKINNNENSNNLANESPNLKSKMVCPEIRNPKLSEFVVNCVNQNQPNQVNLTTNLNSNFSVNSNSNSILFNENSNEVLNTPSKIEKSNVYSVTDNLCYDDSNYEFETDDLGFTICRALEPNLEQHQLHLQHRIELEKVEYDEVDHNNNDTETINQNLISNNDCIDKRASPEESIMYNGVNLLTLDCGKTSDDLVGYALNVARVLFTRDELLNGIFVDPEKKNRSKNRVPFDNHRTQVVKEAIIAKFKYDMNDIETIWKSVRSELNKKLPKKLN